MIERSRSKGFTLLEVMIAIAIVAVVMGISVNRLNKGVDRNMKEVSNSLASMSHYLYNKAAIEGLYVRLIIDLDAQSYSVQATTDPVVISREEDREKEEKIKELVQKEMAEEEKNTPAPSANKDEGAKDEGAKDDSADTEEDAKPSAPKKIMPARPNFAAMDEKILTPKKLPDMVFFKDVWVEHSKQPIEGGQAQIYFFPNGYVESAIINLRDKDDEANYSIEINPLNGRASIQKRYRKPGEE